MEIEFVNWEKFNPRKDIKHPKYVLLSNQLFADPKLFDMEHDEIVTFIYLLCEASKANNGGKPYVSRAHYRVSSRMADRVLDRTIEKLTKLRILKQPRVRGTYASVRDPNANWIELDRMKRIEQGENTDSVQIPPPAIEPVRANPVGLWIQAYKNKYGVRYEVQAKDGKILTTFAKSRTEDQVRTLFACYLAINDKLYSDSKHPLSLFFRDLQKISVAAATGVNPAVPLSRPLPKFDYQEDDYVPDLSPEEAQEKIRGLASMIGKKL